MRVRERLSRMRRPDRKHGSARENRCAQDSRLAADPRHRGEIGMSSLADRLRGIITPNRADVVERAAPAVRATEGDLETLLDGKWYGHCFIVERRLALPRNTAER